jgi:hypothetical protein
MDTAQLALEVPPGVEGSLALAVATASEPVLAAPSLHSSSSKWLPPLTKAQVHYWQELCGDLTRAGTAGVPSAEDFPPDRRPNRATLKAMVQ